MNLQRYIKIDGIYQLLSEAHKTGRPIYIHSPTGVGKTAAVRYFYRNKKVLWLGEADGKLTAMPPEERIAEDTVIFDDVSFLDDSASQQYITSMIRNGRKHAVILGRPVLPVFLIPFSISGLLITADEWTMLLQEKDIVTLASEYGLDTESQKSMNVLRKIQRDTFGYFPCISTIFTLMKNGRSYSEGVNEYAFDVCCRYFDNFVTSRWGDDLNYLMLCMADFSCFSTELARAVSLEKNADALIERCVRFGDVVRKAKGGVYWLRPFYLRYLQWKRRLTWDDRQMKTVWHRACVYLRLHERYHEALMFAGLAGDNDEIRDILIFESESNPALAQFYESREYFRGLSDRVTRSSPALMCGRAMLESVVLCPEESERWYGELRRFAEDEEKPAKDRKAAAEKLLYLDFVLPHRPLLTEEECRRAIEERSSGIDLMRNLSVTGFLPSVINGFRDLTGLMQKDDAYFDQMSGLISGLLGQRADGILQIFTAERAFEMQKSKAHELIGLVQSGIDMAVRSGSPDICFAGIGLLAKIHASEGNIDLAIQQVSDFREKCSPVVNRQLHRNIDALKIWLDLLAGNMQPVAEWLGKVPNPTTVYRGVTEDRYARQRGKAPNEIINFNIADRYCYMIKVAALVFMEHYEEAWTLCMRIKGYLKEYGRTYLDIENTMLQALILARLGQKGWRPLMLEAFTMARQHSMVWAIAQGGGAIRKLFDDQKFLDLLAKDGVDPSEPYCRAVMKKSEQLGLFYPGFFRTVKAPAKPLTAMERRILLLYANGEPTDGILKKLDITSNTLKFHSRNIYRKLGVKNRQEAEKMAVRALYPNGTWGGNGDNEDDLSYKF